MSDEKLEIYLMSSKKFATRWKFAVKFFLSLQKIRRKFIKSLIEFQASSKDLKV